MVRLSDRYNFLSKMVDFLNVCTLFIDGYFRFRFDILKLTYENIVIPKFKNKRKISK
jgi:hypothetical protein